MHMTKVSSQESQTPIWFWLFAHVFFASENMTRGRQVLRQLLWSHCCGQPSWNFRKCCYKEQLMPSLEYSIYMHLKRKPLWNQRQIVYWTCPKFFRNKPDIMDINSYIRNSNLDWLSMYTALKSQIWRLSIIQPKQNPTSWSRTIRSYFRKPIR